MSPRTKRRRLLADYYRRTLAHLRAEPKRTDFPDDLTGAMCYQFAQTRWKTFDMLVLTGAPRTYRRALAQHRGAI